MTVDKKRASVSCVLRTHDIDGNGLWKQVTSQGVPLLEAPMRLEIESAGKDYTAQGGKVTFTEKAADRVQGHASWHAGPVRGRTDFSVEYDGVAKLSLRLEPAQERVDALRLVIPLRTSETWLMHPVTDLLRFHYAGRIPDGAGILWEYSGKTNTVRYTETGKPDVDGKVWDSRHVGRHQLPAPFVPYIWMGGTERGICWFAENDRDWNLDPQRPALEIRRQGETTSLVVHLHAPHIPDTPAHPHLRADGHAGQADARNARELPALVSRGAGHQYRAGGEFRIHACLLLLGRGGAQLRILSRLQEFFRL